MQISICNLRCLSRYHLSAFSSNCNILLFASSVYLSTFWFVSMLLLLASADLQVDEITEMIRIKPQQQQTTTIVTSQTTTPVPRFVSTLHIPSTQIPATTIPTQLPTFSSTTTLASTSNVYLSQANSSVPHLLHEDPPSSWQTGATSTNFDVSNGQLLTLETSSGQRRQASGSKCALVLKRTYIINKALEDTWGERFVFNDVDVDDAKRQVHKTKLCIKFSDIDKALAEAKHKLKFERPPDLTGDTSEASLGALGQLELNAVGILKTKFDLSKDEILNALPMIDMGGTSFNLCPKQLAGPAFCSKSRYRTASAHCNNLMKPLWGASKTPYSRYLPPDYADGLDLPRASRNGQPLPSARLISSLVHADIEEHPSDHSALFASWGQFLDHDMSRHATSTGEFNERLMSLECSAAARYQTNFYTNCTIT